jgi:phosphate transport system substrate-binding protein
MRLTRGRTLSSIVLVVIVLAWALAVAPGCSRNRGKAVKVLGSTSVQPFAEMLSQEFNAGHSDAYVEVDGGGSAAGIKAIAQGYANIGMCSRGLKKGEDFTPITIALDGIAIVVHHDNPVKNLSRQQIRKMFTGEIVNWASLGGRDAKITLITREEGSGTREAFTKMLMDGEPITMHCITEPSNGSVKALVGGDENAIGYMSLGQVEGNVRAVDVDGTVASRDNVVNGTYPLVRPFLFILNGQAQPQSQKFIDFVLSPQGQKMLEDEGLVRAPK